jgi:hypothetical protein
MAERLTMQKAIRKHCVMCSGGSALEVKQCTVKMCYLWPYRNGRGWQDPDTGKLTTRAVSEKQRAAARELVKKSKTKKD